jgi:hypothetical protein
MFNIFQATINISAVVIFHKVPNMSKDMFI